MRNKDQGPGIKEQDTERVKKLLQSAVPPVSDGLEAQRDLWPAMLRRLDEQSSHGMTSVPWFDWALGGALLAFAAMAPRTIPVILFYL
jgi:hypothetical protein